MIFIKCNDFFTDFREMAEFRFGDESSDSDEDDALMAQLVDDLFGGEQDGEQVAERAPPLSDAERMMVMDMALGGHADDGDPVVRMVMMESLERAAGARVGVGGQAGGAAGGGGGLRQPGGGAGAGGGDLYDEGRRIFFRHMVRHRLRHMRAGGIGRLRSEMVSFIFDF